MFWNPAEWRSEDVMNLGLTWFGFVLRITFLVGTGVHKTWMMHFLHREQINDIAVGNTPGVCCVPGREG